MQNKALYAMMLGIAVLSKGLGLFRETALAAGFGSTAITDAYAVAMVIPMMLFAAIGAPIATNLIPQLQQIRARGGEVKWQRFCNNVFNLSLCLSVFVATAGIMGRNQIVAIVSPGFDPQTAAMAADMTAITLPSGIGSVLLTFINSVNGSKRQFLMPTLLALVQNVIGISCIFAARYWGSYWLAVGVSAGIGVQFILQWHLLRQNGYCWAWVFDLKDPDLLRMGKLCMATAAAGMINQLNLIVDRMLASALTTGAISALNYALRINALIYEIALVSLLSLLFPELSTLAAEQKQVAFANCFQKGVRVVVFLMTPVALLLHVFAMEISTLVFMRGAFDLQAAEMTADAVRYLAIGLPAIGIIELCNRAFYSHNDTRMPLYAGIVYIACNIAGSVVLVENMRQGGLALANAIALWLQVVLLLVVLKRRQQVQLIDESSWRIFCYPAAGVAASTVLLLPADWWSLGFLYLAAYLLICGSLKCDEVSGVMRVMRNRIGKSCNEG